MIFLFSAPQALARVPGYQDQQFPGSGSLSTPKACECIKI